MLRIQNRGSAVPCSVENLGEVVIPRCLSRIARADEISSLCSAPLTPSNQMLRSSRYAAEG